MSGWEPFLNALGKYSWRSMFGVVVATGTVLLLGPRLGISTWLNPLRPWLLLAFFASCAILVTHVATFVAQRLSNRKVDLRMVPGNPIMQKWHIGAYENVPFLHVKVAMNFALKSLGTTLTIKNAYPKGTRRACVMMREFMVTGAVNHEVTVHMAVRPIIAKPGKSLKTKIVFVDQFNNKHVSAKITFAPGTNNPSVFGNQPNCIFCHKPISPEELALEATFSAHSSCIWK